MEFAAPIDRIWQITKDIEQAAAVGEWEKAAELANQRSPLLMSLSAKQTDAALDMLKRVHAIDTRIAAEARSAQTALSAEFRSAMQATRNVNQYQRVAQF
ncbi:flagellar protein FliT [Paraburkholderia sp. CNPSo 3281]|uniref:flagellar protein FliT n=1 Tax=Paraburkholderia sp. CNPSo 3281 TaxID=2940933 RepID=UPI0020B8FCFC|nr:flagellar protein FliT [Paraburkholderia sp. CNPSo 3281]MCP3717973.1 flagellar protein FliT [Paraburkholderia sp. CNPSo 3281]